MNKNLKNAISLFVIISVAIMPFLNIQKANAQSASGYITGLAPVIAKLPGCESQTRKASIDSLFTENDTNSTSAMAEGLSTGNYSSALEDIAKTASSEVDSIPTNDLNTITELQKQGKTLGTILSTTQDTKKSVASMDKNDNCLNAIGKAVVKILIQKLTLSIVNWIQTGNSGGPLFVQNPSKFFKDLAKEEILNFGLEINDPNKFPFGKAFLINEANAFNQHFADNAQYSLNEMIQQTTPESSAAAFSADFSMGGWGAWDALTQVPANNPLGFNLMASNELGKRLEGTEKSTAQFTSDALQQSGGFLGDNRCADPVGVTKEENDAALNGDESSRLCKRWEYVTPGKVIGEKLTTAIGYNDQPLLDAQTLNDAIAAILDAVMAKFSSELTTNGLAALSQNNDTSSDQIDLGNLFNNTTTTGTGTQFASSYTTQWIQNHPDFNLHTDVTQALVDEQRTYLDKLDSYNTALSELIEWTRQLDYCIPGPNPDWETTTSNAIESIHNPTSDDKSKNFWTETGGTLLHSLADPGGIFSFIGTGTNISSNRAKKAAATFIQTILDVGINPDQDQITNQGGIDSLLTNIFASYKSLIEKTYFTATDESAKYMPGVTLEARAEFKKIAGYEQIIQNNIDETTFRKSVITRLENFKEKIDNGTIASADLDDPSSQAVNEFARISANFVSGDDIAKIDNLYKQALDETTYVKNDLLGGDFGCEKEMHDLWKNDPATYSKYVRRQAYPYPIDHLYPGDGKEPYDIPYNSVDIEKMITPVQFLTSGGGDPNNGFLYGSTYGNDWAGSGGRCPEYIGTVALSAKNAEDKSTDILGALQGKEGDFRDIGMESPPADDCGVVTRGFEKIFNVY